jgi:hypothetical protein
LGLALVALGSWYSYDEFRSDRALQEAIAEADRLDPGWRLEEIEAKRAKVPDAENSALCVLKVNELLSKLTAQQSAKEQARANHLWNDMSGLSPEVQLTEEQTRELSAMLKKLDPALKEAAGLKDLPHGRYQVQWLFLGALTRLASGSARTVAGLLQMDGWVKSQDGNVDGALDDALLILNVGRSVGDEPSAISQLIRMSCQALGVHVCERVLAQGASSDGSLARMEKALLEEGKDPLVLYALRGERAHFHRLAEAVRSGETSLATGAGVRTPGVSLGSSMWAGFAETIVMRRNHAPGLHLSTQLVEIAKLLVEQQGPEIKKLQAGVTSLPVLVALQFPAHEKVFQAFARTQAMLRTATVGVAVERYRLSKGRWPENLAEVGQAALIQEIPTDPYNGEPVRYRRLKDGVVIYSVGPDGKDDGGLINRKGDPTKSGYDLGFQLWDIDKRRQPPPPKPKNDDETETEGRSDPAKQ